jgi:hypothetical protein
VYAAPSIGVLAVLYLLVMAVLVGLAIYVLILLITFLQLRILSCGAPRRPREAMGRK